MNTAIPRAALAVVVAVALVGCTSATPPAPAPASSLQPKLGATASPALPQQEGFYVVRLPTKGRLSEPVKCRIGDRESFTVGYVYETMTGEEWRSGRANEPLGLGHYGEPLRAGSGYDVIELIGSRIYVRGVPGERVLVRAPSTGGDTCFVGQLTGERLPP